MSFNFSNRGSISTVINSGSGTGSSSSGTLATRAGLTFDNYVGKVVDGVLQAPISNLGNHICTGIVDIADSAAQTIFNNKTVTSVAFPNLVRISGNNACSNMLFGKTELESIDVSNLEVISGNNACSNMLYNTNIQQIDFEKLREITGSYACQYMLYNDTNLENVYFRAVDVNSFGQYKNQFYNLLYGNGNKTITVHFPMNMKPIISTLDGYPTFGGNSNKIIIAYDLPATSGSIYTENVNSKISVNDEVFNGTYYHNGFQTSCIVFDAGLNCFYSREFTPSSLDENIEISTPEENLHTITLQVGIPNLTVSFAIGKLKGPATADGNGNYSFKYIPANEEITYVINGGLEYESVSDSITTTGNDMVIPITLASIAIETFEQPNLSRGIGILGVDEAALWANRNLSDTQYGLNYMMDGYDYDDDMEEMEEWYIYSSNVNVPLIFYNEDRLRADTLTLQGRSFNNLKSIKVYGSNSNYKATVAANYEYYDHDYEYGYGSSVDPNAATITFSEDASQWTEINYTLTTDTNNKKVLQLDNDIFYNYYKIVFVQSSTAYFSELTFTGLIIKSDNAKNRYLASHKVAKIKSSTNTTNSETEAILFDYNVSGTGIFNNAFCNMPNLETVILKNFRCFGGYKTGSLKYTFQNNNKLKNLIILSVDGWNKYNNCIGIFNGSDNIERIFISKNCSTNTSNSYLPYRIFNALSSKNCTIYTDAASNSNLNTYFSGKTKHWNYPLNDFYELLENDGD